MEAKITHANPEDFDVTRKRSGDGFKYYKGDKQLKDSEDIKEIESLVIPPNWQDVEICTDNCKHIRAFGYDEKGRKQYIYNEEWSKMQNEAKFDRMHEFASVLPKIRKTAHKHIEHKDWVKNKALGLVVLTLDETYIRIGNVTYENANSTYGLTTLRRRHVTATRNEIVFDFKGKSNKYRKVKIENGDLVKLIRKSSDLPGYEIFRYKNGSGFKPVSSTDVNEYLKKITDADYSAKDFRTWGGTSLAVELIPEALEKIKENPRLKLSTTLVKLVANQLGNTVAICREYYIHPKIMELVEDEAVDRLKFRNHRKGKYSLTPAEKKALELIS